MSPTPKSAPVSSLDHRAERIDLACAFRWAARLNWHEAVANHFSLAVSDDGTRFLMNPNQRHFSLLRASDMVLLDANDEGVMETDDAPDPTAWGLHGAIHRRCPHARCIMHLHPRYATALACLADSTLPPIDQNTAMFFGRYVVDDNFGGLAMRDEGERCAALLSDPAHFVMIMGNHGVLVLGATVAETFNRLYYFERAAKTYLTALSSGQPLRVLPEALAARVADALEHYPGQAERHFADRRTLLDREEPDYRQ